MTDKANDVATINAGRVAFVTGAATGMGLSIAQYLSAAGHPVALVGLQSELLHAAAEELQQAGGRAIAVEVDVSNREQVDAAVAATREQLGPISIIVTSAGVTASTPFAELTLAQWEKVIAINLTGTFHCIQSAISDMVAAGWGRIVTISSSSAQSGAMNRANYVASKAGVIGLTKALSMEFAPLGITVNTIPPSIIDTPMARTEQAAGRSRSVEEIGAMAQVRRAGTGDDIAAACRFLCSDEAGFITGQQIGVNGGFYV